MNFAAEYYPSLDQLTDAQIAAARQFVVSTLSGSFANTELAPGTPTGDLVVNALAAFVAASDEAHTRLMSDLDLENVANSIIYSCDFVRAYLGNFGVYDVSNLRATGVVRLTFTEDAEYTLGKNVVFRMGNTDDYTPLMGNSELSAITIKPSSTLPTGADDTYILSQTSAVTWSVDVPVTGVLTADVVRGAAGASTWSESRLSSITAAIDFLPGVPEAGLSDLAKAARAIGSSLTSASRSGIRTLVLRNWPETRMVSPVLTGDAEMQRSVAGTAMALQQPAVDLYVRSARDMQLESQTVRLEYVTVGSEQKFRGKLPLLSRPSKIVSVEWSGGAGGVESSVLYSLSENTGILGSLYCGSRYETLWIDVTPAMDPVYTTTPVIDVLEDGESSFAYFTVVYAADPLVNTMASIMESSENAPTGVNLLVRSGPLADVASMTITYRRQPGTKMLLTSAATAIASYMKECGYPNPFRITAIHDIMKTAGAAMVYDVGVTGAVKVTPADRRFIQSLSVDPAEVLTQDWEALSIPADSLTITSAADLSTAEIVLKDVDGTLEMWAATEKTMRYNVDSANIQFVEA